VAIDCVTNDSFGCQFAAAGGGGFTFGKYPMMIAANTPFEAILSIDTTLFTDEGLGDGTGEWHFDLRLILKGISRRPVQ
jgi:hypothetical protein